MSDLYQDSASLAAQLSAADMRRLAAYVSSLADERDSEYQAALLAAAQAFVADFQEYIDSDDGGLPDHSDLLAAIAKALDRT